MKIVFTICSNNYIAQALTLFNSIQTYTSDFKMILGICDKKDSEINYNFNNVQVVFVDELGIPDLQGLINKYNIIELNTSVKATYFKYLIALFKPEFIIYLDPDVKVYNSLNLVIEEFSLNIDILVTPHIIQPIKLDTLNPKENLFLNHGIYNLGFLALRTDSNEVRFFIDWWEERLFQLCFSDLKNGLFVDQLWINLIPLYFDNVRIIKKKGFNMAPWNVHERIIINYQNGEYILDDNSVLVFYHFSNYNYKFKFIATPKYNRFNLIFGEYLYVLYNDYHSDLITNNIEFYNNRAFLLTGVTIDKIDKEISIFSTIKKFLFLFCPPVIFRFYKNFNEKI